MTFVVRDTDREVPANAVECYDCGQTWTGPDVADLQGEDWDICPSDDTHAAVPVHVTKTALGLPDDREFLIVRDGTYVYPLEEK